MKKLEGIKQRLIDMQTENSTQLADIQSRIGESMQDKVIAEADMKAATENVNPTKYKEAAEESRRAEDMIKMLKEKRSMLMAPLIDEADYRSLVKEILETLDQMNCDNKKKAAEHAQKILEIKAETNEAITLGNSLLQTLQVDVYRQKSMLTESHFLHPTEQLRYKKTGLLEIIGQMASQIAWLKNGEI